MISVEQLETEIERLPHADQWRLLEDLSWRLGKDKTRAIIIVDDASLEAMSKDPEIQREIAAISSEFSITEFDGMGAGQ